MVLGLIVLPTGAAVVLYLVHLRNPRQAVAYVALWQRVAARALRARGWRRLTSALSLALQIAFIVLVALGLGRPRFGFQSREGRAVVFVVDNSASMRALEGRRRHADHRRGGGPRARQPGHRADGGAPRSRAALVGGGAGGGGQLLRPARACARRGATSRPAATGAWWRGWSTSTWAAPRTRSPSTTWPTR
jgi:hypothetical protein